MFIDSFIGHLRSEKKYSRHTLRAYAGDLCAFERFLESLPDAPDISGVDIDVVRLWVAGLMESGCAPSSVCRKLSALRSFYAYLRREGEAELNPALSVQGPKSRRLLPSFIKEEEMNKLIDEISFGTGFDACRDRAIILCFYETGIRLSELVGLNVCDVDINSMSLKVLGKRNRERVVPFVSELKGELEFYMNERAGVAQPQEKALFVTSKGVRVSHSQVYRIVKKNLSKVSSVEKRSPHVLRHSFATAMLNNEAELLAVKELLGHKRLSTTEIYTHLTFEELKRFYDKAHPRAGNN
ncbi:MAG: tyrosine-type recombinase/integrase [Bacteroidaceae bacterium]|nr:tyrosine-type recombinase/integrase [Bacteroidaceae bacterium]